MSDPINANPSILDENAMPTRAIKGKAPVVDRNIQELFAFSLLHTAEPASGNVPALVSDTESEQEEEDPIDSQEIYDLIAHISDPEHPLSLGLLSVINLPDIQVHDSGDRNSMSEVVIRITPTITHCSLATLIGLGIRVRLDRCLPPRFRITILIKEGTHQSENQVNKQLNDKERVAAACENDQLLSVISQMLATCK
ncbi:hypothetical protein BABINDRAFT_158948 [Babjeviella inositovora NRRL Y-12698]|uniref:Uncharacterized protein n=1 Tax=Babjeviella inositovora NRRL Y-12698 TaxID=984486 RepID=A0A1E3QXC2_9ASCO|nr:uncharacterized protein BABINDRAFT_158948 [Babjeviella inositovora NRRL Y-12698]ODQ82329.1 hypothetical protein BABINDRAFT_158948 [Babjeviella inositovora NRRL Y-12698]